MNAVHYFCSENVFLHLHNGYTGISNHRKVLQLNGQTELIRTVQLPSEQGRAQNFFIVGPRPNSRRPRAAVGFVGRGQQPPFHQLRAVMLGLALALALRPNSAALALALEV